MRAWKVFGALSDATRLKLFMFILEREEVSASELSSSVGLEGGALYHHLSRLESAGLIEKASRGRYAVTEFGRRFASFMKQVFREGDLI